MAKIIPTFDPQINRFFTSYISRGLTSGFSAQYKTKPGYLLHDTLGGQVIFNSGGVERGFSNGDLVLIDPLVHHDYRVVSPQHPWKVVCVHFFARPTWHSLLDWPELAPGFRHINLDSSTNHHRVTRKLIACHQLAQGPWQHGQALAEAELEAALTWCAELGPHRQKPIDTRLEQAIHYVYQHLAEPINQQQIAKHVGWSPTHLRARFQEVFNCTPLQYLDRLRMERAVELLQMTDEPVYQIATEVGYDDPAYFSRRFRQIQGYSPRQCRHKTR